MYMKITQLRTLTLVTLILAAAFSRIVPHMPNFSPIDAITLFAAAHFARVWQVFLIPFMAMWLSSLFIDNVQYAASQTSFVWMYPGFHWQYLGFFIVGLLGLFLFRRGISILNVVVGTLASGMVFFLISNFGVWIQGGLYSHDLAGFIACYLAAIPFYQGTFLGDVFYCTGLFSGFGWLSARYSSLLEANQPA
jgi:hypothetical protein